MTLNEFGSEVAWRIRSRLQEHWPMMWALKVSPNWPVVSKVIAEEIAGAMEAANRLAQEQAERKREVDAGPMAEADRYAHTSSALVEMTKPKDTSP